MPLSPSACDSYSMLQTASLTVKMLSGSSVVKLGSIEGEGDVHGPVDALEHISVIESEFMSVIRSGSD